MNKELDFLQAFDTSISRIKPSEFAEQNRVMGTSETRWPGPYSFDLTPYLREVVDCLMPDVPVTQVAVMKGAQIGYSTGVIENAIPWIISQYPANILLMAADDDAVKLAAEQKIEPAIASCGVGHLIGPNKNGGMKTQRSGNTQKGKEFVGGRLYMHSVKNARKMRQFSAKYGFLDDLDSGKDEDAKEGSLIKLVDARFTTFGDTRKIFYISTPIIKQSSIIEPLFEKGDQRYYFVPCPHCGSYQRLQWSVDVDKSIVKSGKAGIHYQLDLATNTVIQESVVYICEHCGKAIEERHKYEMNLAGEWRPTATPKTPDFRSYHISALYSPPGAYTWARQAQEWADCWPKENNGKPNIKLLKTFKNLVLGQTFEDIGRVTDFRKLALNTRNEYKIGIVPQKLSKEDGNGSIVILTIACDLNGTIDDARLDYLVVGWSETGTTYAIDHGSIGSYQGRKSKPEDQREVMTYRPEQPNNVWDRFYKIVNQNWHCDDGGQPMRASITLVDTGFHTNFAYQFIDRMPLILGVKGHMDKYTMFDDNAPLFKESGERNDVYVVQVNKYKDKLADRIEYHWDREGEQPNGFMNFPQPNDGKFDAHFFIEYAGEVKKFKLNDDGSAIGSMWTKKHSSSPNHFWDCEIYNMAARDIFVYLCLKDHVKKPTWHTLVQMIKNQ